MDLSDILHCLSSSHLDLLRGCSYRRALRADAVTACQWSEQQRAMQYGGTERFCAGGEHGGNSESRKR